MAQKSACGNPGGQPKKCDSGASASQLEMAELGGGCCTGQEQAKNVQPVFAGKTHVLAERGQWGLLCLAGGARLQLVRNGL